MKRLLVALILITLVAAPAFAQDDTPEMPSIIIRDAWARPTALEETTEPPTGPTAAYMMLENPTDAPLYLIAASTPGAVVEIHETKMNDGVMQMNPVEAITIAPGEMVNLEPGGYHLMLLELEQHLLPDTAIAIRPTFSTDPEDPEASFDLTTAAWVGDFPPENPTDITITGAWARPTALEALPKDAEPLPISPSAAYMHITNSGEENLTLDAAYGEFSDAIELHTTRMEDGVMRMEMLENGIELPAGETVILKPGGMHIMLMQLQHDLLPGEAIALTLHFSDDREMKLAVPITEEMANAMSMGAHD